MQQREPDIWDTLGYLVAAAILVPFGMWLKQTDFALDWFRALF